MARRLLLRRPMRTTRRLLALMFVSAGILLSTIGSAAAGG